MTSTDLDPHPAIQPLSQKQCLGLLSAAAIGRVGFVSPEGVEIIPVGYRLGTGPRLFIKTQPWGIIGQLAERGGPCSFEVDYHSSNPAPGGAG
ncbi:MAG: hypothetical protein ACRYG2_01970 [Janthinobacterium lividum]